MVTAAMARRAGARGLDRVRDLGREAAAAAERTPLEVSLGVALWMGYATALETQSFDPFIQLLVTVALALPLVYGLSVLGAAGRIEAWHRWLSSGVVVLASAAYGFLVFSPHLASEGWRFALLLGAASAANLSVPLAARPHDMARRAWVHRYATRLATRIGGVGLYAGVLYGGLAGALAAISGLFSVQIHEHVYGHLAGLLFLMLPPWAVAAGLPQLLARPQAPGELTLAVLRRLGLFLLAPLIGVYVGIVYAYLLRVMVTGEVPRNLVSPVVLGAGALILLVLLVLEPMREGGNARGMARFLGILPPLLLPLAALALWAVLIRVGQHGWTEFRYVRVMAVAGLGAFAAYGAWRLARRAPPPLSVLPPILAVTLLLMAVGPWSAPAVAHRDQSARLASVLAQASATRAVESPAALSAASYFQAIDLVRYLGSHFGWDRIARYTPSGAVPPDGQRSPELLAAALGIRVAPAAGEALEVVARLAPEAAIPGIMGGTAHGLAPGAPGRWSGGLAVSTDSAAARLDIEVEGDTPFRVDLAPLLSDLHGMALAEGRAEPRRPVRDGLAPNPAVALVLDSSRAVLPILDPAGFVRGQLLLRSVRFTTGPEGDSAGRRLLEWSGAIILAPAP
jgi:hypothetical protein